MLLALATLLLCQLLGQWLAAVCGWSVPGPVVGLVLLWLVLLVRPTWATALQPTAHGLLGHLSLLFVPAGVGVVQHVQRLGQEALAIGLALVVSTALGLLASAWTTRWVLRRHREDA